MKSINFDAHYKNVMRYYASISHLLEESDKRYAEAFHLILDELSRQQWHEWDREFHLRYLEALTEMEFEAVMGEFDPSKLHRFISHQWMRRLIESDPAFNALKLRD